MAQKPETRFRQNTVIPFLVKLKNTTYFSIQQVALRGTPDLLLCVRGNFVALELKDRGKKPDALQKFNLEAVTKAKGVALVADPDNWERVANRLRLMDEGEL